MNETIKSILGRRSIRSYETTPVEKEKIDLILECGQYAASGMNRQPWYFTVITNRDMLDKIVAANKETMLKSPDENLRAMAGEPGFDNFRGAPMAIIVSGAEDMEGSEIDCGNAVENMAIAAYSLGLGSCYIASFRLGLAAPEGAYLLKELAIPKGYAPFFALSLGYGNEILEERAPRKENAIHFIG